MTFTFLFLLFATQLDEKKKEEDEDELLEEVKMAEPPEVCTMTGYVV